eukprot:358521-Chlamydomonas_euryale.AAC.11
MHLSAFAGPSLPGEAFVGRGAGCDKTSREAVEGWLPPPPGFVIRIGAAASRGGDVPGAVLSSTASQMLSVAVAASCPLAVGAHSLSVPTRCLRPLAAYTSAWIAHETPSPPSSPPYLPPPKLPYLFPRSFYDAPSLSLHFDQDLVPPPLSPLAGHSVRSAPASFPPSRSHLHMHMLTSQVTSQLELKKVLTELGGMTAEDVIAFELLWTPQVQVPSYNDAPFSRRVFREARAQLLAYHEAKGKRNLPWNEREEEPSWVGREEEPLWVEREEEPTMRRKGRGIYHEARAWPGVFKPGWACSSLWRVVTVCSCFEAIIRVEEHLFLVEAIIRVTV